jgi:hypothetical protein
MKREVNLLKQAKSAMGGVKARGKAVQCLLIQSGVHYILP